MWAKAQVVDPLLLATRMADNCAPDAQAAFPESIASLFDSEIVLRPDNAVLISIGMFTVVQLERPVQMTVPVYDFSIPEKECIVTSDDPCDFFKKIKFPVNEFFPPKQSEESDCGCSR